MVQRQYNFLLQAHSIGKNDEVLVQSLTYLSTYQAISATGAKPISCEVYQDTMTIDIEDAQNKISNKTKAIYHWYTMLEELVI